MTTVETATTWGDALADLRDTVAANTGWSLHDDNSGGKTALDTNTDWWVWSTPDGEHLRVLFDGTLSVEWQYGATWDAAGNSWTDQYAVSYPNQYGVSPIGGSYNSTLPGDDVNYYLWHDSSGFGFYAKRTEASENKDFYLCFARVDKLWDYSTAGTRESHGVISIGGHRNYSGNAYQTYDFYFGEGGKATRIGGHASANPDANVHNFVYSPLIFGSSRYQQNYTWGTSSTRTGETPVGTQDQHIKGGEGAAHLDTIQDSGGITQYRVFRAHDSRLVLRWT